MAIPAARMRQIASAATPAARIRFGRDSPGKPSGIATPVRLWEPGNRIWSSRVTDHPRGGLRDPCVYRLARTRIKIIHYRHDAEYFRCRRGSNQGNTQNEKSPYRQGSIDFRCHPEMARFEPRLFQLLPHDQSDYRIHGHHRDPGKIAWLESG